MRVLFVTYCFGNYEGQALIGVYKRGLRIAMALCDRGHEVVFFCTGREAYQDDLTALAEQRMDFIDIPFSVAAFEDAEQNRQVFLEQIAAIDPDLIVVGEVPLAGAMLETALCAGELRIPLVILDNAYNPLLVSLFCEAHGSIADGIILAGPSSFQMPDPPPYLCQVPPYIESAPQAARAMLADELGLEGDRLVTVLAYDTKVERLALSLVETVDEPDFETLFLSRNPDKCREQLDRLPDSVRRNSRVIPQPPDPLLFGLLELSRLAIVKYGFMQVSECLALRTPVIVVYHEGPTWLEYLPEACRPFAHVTSLSEADAATIAAARRFLSNEKAEMDGVHSGELGAVAKAADFLERLPRDRLRETSRECFARGFTPGNIQAALRRQVQGQAVMLRALRSTRLRRMADSQLHALLCRYTVAGEERVARLWGRLYDSGEAARADGESAVRSERQVLYFSAAERVLIEADIGQAMLPPL
ncbi:MAG: hypothetical protein M5U01_14960 [Ardenticatenaceae bacterium]|nr:hypothetical protein [Ardenticatenaceae bacterium]HBY92992.1 hypothetical protein [Chloroflexota bacterium]